LRWDAQTVSLRVGPALKKVSEMMEISRNGDKVSRDRTILSYFEVTQPPQPSQPQKISNRVKSARMKTILLKLLHKKYPPGEALRDTESKSSLAKNNSDSKKRTRKSSKIDSSAKKKKRKSGD